MAWRCKIAEPVTRHVEGPAKGKCDCHVEPVFCSSQKQLESRYRTFRSRVCLEEIVYGRKIKEHGLAADMSVGNQLFPEVTIYKAD